MTSLDPALCADGCGRLAETERPTADGRTEQTCSEHAEWSPYQCGRRDALREVAAECSLESANPRYVVVQMSADTYRTLMNALGEHSSNPREDG